MGGLNVTKVRRAWNGRIARVDSLMAWMYSMDILNKSEKELKDRLFHKYYRFYNDGDRPRGKKYSGLYNNKDIELVLEQEITDFMVKILSKYDGKYNRRDFLVDKAKIAKNNSLEGANLDDYYARRYAEAYNLPEVVGLLDQIALLNKEARGLIEGHFENFLTTK